MQTKSKITDIVLIAILVVGNILPGTPLRYNIDIPNMLINIVALVYLIAIVYRKERININKADVLIMLFSFSTFISLICYSYLRLSDTVEYIFRYLTAMNIYFIVRRYIKIDYCKKIKLICKTISVLSICIIFIGMDMMIFNTFGKLYNFLRVPILYSDSKERMASLFKYSNTFGIYILIALSITMNNYLSADSKRVKAFYASIIFTQFFALIMTYSRLNWLLLVLFLGIYIILAKNKRKVLFKLLLLASLFSFVLYIVFNILILSKYKLFIWIIMCILYAFCFAIYDFKDKINSKSLVIITLVLTINGFIILLISVLVPQKLVIFNNKEYKNNYRKQNISIEKNRDYTLTIDLESISKEKDNFTIFVKQLDNKEQKVIEDKVQIDNFDGIKKIDFHTQNETQSVSIIFKCNNPSNDTSLTINSVKLNDKKIKMNYGIIPISLVNRLEKLKINTASTETRINYIKNGVQLANTHIFTGLGGYAWKNANVDNIELYSIAEHCYPLQLVLQNGIFSLVIYIFILVIVTKKSVMIIKNKNTDLFGIILAFYALTIHSLLDFDMYFQIILIEMFIFIAIINGYDTNEKKTLNDILVFTYFLLLIFFLYFNIGEVITLHMKNTNQIENSFERLSVIRIKKFLSPYYYKYYKDEKNCLETIRNTGLSTPELEIEKRIIKDIEFITFVEKNKEDGLLLDLILNEINLINEENQEEILDYIDYIWKNEMSKQTENMYLSIKGRLEKILNNEKTQIFIQQLYYEKY